MHMIRFRIGLLENMAGHAEDACLTAGPAHATIGGVAFLETAPDLS